MSLFVRIIDHVDLRGEVAWIRGGVSMVIEEMYDTLGTGPSQTEVCCLWG
jgi:ketol-acid reductoisomerase